MEKNKIGLGQFTLLLTVIRIFNLLNYIPEANRTRNMLSLLLGNALSLAFSIVIALTVGLLYKKCGGKNPIEALKEKNRFLSLLLSVIFGVPIFLSLCGSLAAFSYFLTSEIYPDASGIFITALMGLSCFLGAFYGIEGISRASFIIFFYFVGGFLFVAAGAFKNFDFGRIMPILEHPLADVFGVSAEVISKTFEFIVAMALFSRVKTKKGVTSGLVWFYILYFLISEGLLFLTAGIFGEFALSLEFPLYSLVSTAEISIFKQLNTIHMVLWVFVSFIRISVLIFALKEILNSALKKSLGRASLILILPPIVAVSIYLSAMGEKIKSVNPTSGITVIAASFVVPLILIIYFSAKKRSKNEESNVNLPFGA